MLAPMQNVIKYACLTMLREAGMIVRRIMSIWVGIPVLLGSLQALAGWPAQKELPWWVLLVIVTVAVLWFTFWTLGKRAYDLEQERKPKIIFTKPRKRSSFKDTEMYIHLEIGIKNISSIEDLSNCQVEMTELRLEGGIDFYKDFPLPISLRTMHQIGDRPKGRFNLDANREKFISVANISLKQHEDIIEIQHDGSYCPKISRNNYKMKLKAYPGGIEKLFLLKVKKQDEEEIIPLSENT